MHAHRLIELFFFVLLPIAALLPFVLFRHACKETSEFGDPNGKDDAVRRSSRDRFRQHSPCSSVFGVWRLQSPGKREEREIIQHQNT